MYDQDVDVPNLALAKPPESGRLNREAYLWTIDATIALQTAINQLISTFNANGIVDYEQGDTEKLALWLPHRLAIDDFYMVNLNRNFALCTKLLDSLDAYLRQMLPSDS